MLNDIYLVDLRAKAQAVAYPTRVETLTSRAADMDTDAPPIPKEPYVPYTFSVSESSI